MFSHYHLALAIEQVSAECSISKCPVEGHVAQNVMVAYVYHVHAYWVNLVLLPQWPYYACNSDGADIHTSSFLLQPYQPGWHSDDGLMPKHWGLNIYVHIILLLQLLCYM